MKAMNDPSRPAGTTGIAEHLAFGGPKRCRNLYFEPILLRVGGQEHSEPYLSALEALETGVLTASETGLVSALGIENRADRPVLIPKGFHFTGGGQDRMASASVVVDAHARGELPVTCVQERRWNPDPGQTFSTPADGGSIVASSIVEACDPASGDAQRDVWTTVEDIAGDTQTTSRSSRHADVSEHAAGELAEFHEVISLDGVPPNAIGALFAVNLPRRGTHWSIDLFGRTDLFRVTFTGLRNAAAVEALRAREPGGDFVPEGISDDFRRFLVRLVHETPLAPQHVPINRGQFSSGTAAIGARVSLLEDRGALVHAQIRWTTR